MPIAHHKWIRSCQLHYSARAGWSYYFWDLAAADVRRPEGAGCAAGVCNPAAAVLCCAVQRKLAIRALPAGAPHPRSLLFPSSLLLLQALIANHFPWFLDFWQRNASKAIEKSDLLRYAVLHHVGGEARVHQGCIQRFDRVARLLWER